MHNNMTIGMGTGKFHPLKFIMHLQKCLFFVKLTKFNKRTEYKTVPHATLAADPVICFHASLFIMWFPFNQNLIVVIPRNQKVIKRYVGVVNTTNENKF